MKRKFLSLILVFAMTVSLLTVGTGAVEPTYGDTADHWAESSIERWSAYGIIQGSNGLFAPDGQLTCAQLATILAKLLKLPAAKDAGFSDNKADAWYYDAINRCTAAGILNGNGDGTVTPEAPIARERAMVMLARALGIEPLRNPDLTRYTDAAQVSAYAQGYVAALIEAGIVGGVTADELAPQDNINRASTVTILDRAIGTYADKAGATVKADGKGIVLVVADDVTVTGNVDKLLVPADNVDVTVSGSKNIDDITVTGDNSKVILNNSTANDVTLDGKNTELETKSGSKVENVSVTEDAKGATVNAGSGTTIGTVDSKADNVSISGDGKVENASVSGDNTKVNTKDTKVDVDEGVTGTTAGGKDVAGGSSTTTKPSTPSGGGGGGYVHSHSYANEWSKDVDYHWHACACGAVSDKDEHTWNAGEITTPATYEAAGVQTYTCTVCGQTKTEEIPQLTHTYADTWSKNETHHWHACTDAGYTTLKKDEAKHTWNAGEVSDCVKTYTCTVCNQTKTEDAHNYVDGVCTICGTIGENVKFYLGVTSGNTVDAIVTDDYKAMFRLPAVDSTVSTASVTMTAKMQNVASLGVNGLRQHEVTLNTGDTLGNHDVVLSGWLDSCYAFSGATINVTIDGKACSYNLASISDNKIVATPESAKNAADVWGKLTSHIEPRTQKTDDSKIVIGNGSWMKIGKEWLHFEDGVTEDLVLNNFSKMSALQQKIRDAVCLDTDANGELSKIVLFVKAGTQLAVGQSIAELEKDCTITITGNANQIFTKLGGKLAALRDTHDTYTMTKNLVELFDAVVGTIDASNNVTVNMTFGA